MTDRIDAAAERDLAHGRAALIEARDTEQRGADDKRVWVRYLADRGVSVAELNRLSGASRTTIYAWLNEPDEEEA